MTHTDTLDTLSALRTALIERVEPTAEAKAEAEQMQKDAAADAEAITSDIRIIEPSSMPFIRLTSVA